MRPPTACRSPTGSTCSVPTTPRCPTGKILIVGGALPFDTPGAQRGADAICLFTPQTNTLERIGQMFEGRMYPTLVGLADGTYAVFSGFTAAPTTPGTVADSVELLRPPFFPSRRALYRTARLTGAARALPTYPGLLLAPGGAVFHLGTTWQYAGLDPRGGDVGTPAADRRADDQSDPQQNRATWNDLLPDRLQPHREEGTFVLLPPAQEGKVLVLGGGHIENFGTDPIGRLSPRARRRSARGGDLSTRTTPARAGSRRARTAGCTFRGSTPAPSSCPTARC